METAKAIPRRIRMGFYARYCQGHGIDVGVGRQESPGGEDKVVPWARGWDKDDGDAHYLAGVEPHSQDFIHSSHCLEHLEHPHTALQSWFRVLKPGGYLLLLLPHRDLYEKRTTGRSVWNADHKFFYLPDEDDLPVTRGLLPLLRQSLPKDAWQLVSLHLAAFGYWKNGPHHPQGEYSFEAIIRKR